MTALPDADGFTSADLEAMRTDVGHYELVDGLIVITQEPDAGGFTKADLDALPDDGRRSELIDGVIVVTPSPVTRHQDIVLRLAVILDRHRTSDVKVMVAPFDVALTTRRVLEPDVLVARRADLTSENLPVAPVLAVEVLSPSTRRVDLGPKRRILAEAGCPSYWVIDPGKGSTPPTLTVLELDDETYAEVARVSGAESWTATRPFPVTVTPIELLDD